MQEFGFKKLDENNWLKSNIDGLHRVLPDGSSRPILPKEWIEDIQKSKLYDTTPFEIQKLFEVAKGTMIYGYFFYPILTLASEQFARIAETAINIKCSTINCPKARNTFRKKVDWLLQESILSDDLYTKWKSIVELRNRFSHPSRQNIFNPAMAIGLMDSVAKNINHLFSKDS
jgi:hypothetical protein